MKARPIRIDQLTAALFNHLAENTRILDKLTADAGQARTMDDCQKLLDQTGRQVEAQDAANQGPRATSTTATRWSTGSRAARLVSD